MPEPEPTGTARRFRATWLVNVVVALAAIGVFAIALSLGSGKGQFGGTDAAATAQIERVDPGYKPWFKPLWTQPGGEVESGLFALQAALGAGVLGFVLGSYRARRRSRTGTEPGQAERPEPGEPR